MQDLCPAIFIVYILLLFSRKSLEIVISYFSFIFRLNKLKTDMVCIYAYHLLSIFNLNLSLYLFMNILL